ncbi:MAG: protease modulator HflC [Alphaproteobacteria bacterium]|nr:MAG: protease modulator HflC [Alphaproteobacteria bacterium]
MSIRSLALIALGFVILLVLSAGMFTVRETEQGIVMQYGEPKRVVRDAGLHWKVPVLQQVKYLERRILNLDMPAQEVITSDQKRLEVDAFARFRIVDPLLTYQAVGTEERAALQLSNIVQSNVRQVLGAEAMRSIVSGERGALMARIRDLVNSEAKGMGIEIVDMRLRRVDLPEANSKAIYERMRTEREREAEEARAEGREQAARIRAQAERERTVLLAEAQRDAQRIRGEGDGRAVKIFADAFGKDPEFFAFYRSMEAYRKALDDNNTTLVLSPDSEFFDYFEDRDGRRKEKR